MKRFYKKVLAAKPQQPQAGNLAVKDKVGGVTEGTKAKSGLGVIKTTVHGTKGKFKPGAIVKTVIKTAQVVVQGIGKRKKPVSGEARADHAVDRMVTGLNAARVSGVMPKVY
jgi:hypothetical protein